MSSGLLSITVGFIILLINFNCNSQLRQHDEPKIVSKQDSLLNGVWWLDLSDNSALFMIEEDTLVYTEDLSNPYRVEVKGDTLILSQEDFLSKFSLLKLTSDSLIFYDPTIKERIKLFKRKE
jgi:hypothetical protein